MQGVTVLGYHGANVIVMLTPEQLKEVSRNSPLSQKFVHDVNIFLDIM